MAIYAVGDIQGCFKPFLNLLETINFNPKADTLWITGDLVNRGPNSLEVLRYVKALGDKHITILGNHDLHLLASVYGSRKIHSSDTFADILVAKDKVELLEW